MSRSRPLEVRFAEKVDKNGPVPAHRPELGPCHIWTGSTGSKGYGQIFADGRVQTASRVALILDGRDPEPGQEALHACDNHPCVNPAHLSWGTRSDNQRDSVAKGRNGAVTKPERIARGDRTGSRLYPERRPRGEGHRIARLTDREVASIKVLLDVGVTRTLLAHAFGVSLSAISLISLGKTWRHVA